MPWAQEAPGSNPGAPTTNSVEQLRFFLRYFSTFIGLGNIWDQLLFEQVDRISLDTPAGARVDLQSRRHMRMSKLCLCNLQRSSLRMQQRAMRLSVTFF